MNGIIGTWSGPDAPGTAYVMMHHSVGDIGDGEIASWGYPEGGVGAVGDACASAGNPSVPRSARTRAWNACSSATTARPMQPEEPVTRMWIGRGI